jgi:hypothetical protein
MVRTTSTGKPHRMQRPVTRHLFSQERKVVRNRLVLPSWRVGDRALGAPENLEETLRPVRDDSRQETV